MNDAGFPIEDPAWAPPALGWHMHADGLEPAREADIESRFTTANGLLAMRGARDLGRAAFWTSWITTFRPISWPRCYVAGLFDVPDIEPPIPVAMPAPDWLRLRLSVDGTLVRLRQGADLSRTLDLRRGLLRRGPPTPRRSPSGAARHRLPRRASRASRASPQQQAWALAQPLLLPLLQPPQQRQQRQRQQQP